MATRKRKGSRANRNWATAGGALGGNTLGGAIGMIGGPIGGAIGGIGGGIAGGITARRAYNNRRVVSSNPRGSKGRSRSGGGRRQRRNRKGQFA